MRHSNRAALCTHQPGSRLLGTILMLVWLVALPAPMATTAGADHQPGTDEFYQATTDRPLDELPRSHGTPKSSRGFAGSVDASRYTLANGSDKAAALSSAMPQDEGWDSGFHLPGIDSDVWALAFGPDGSLYAGGWFSTARGAPGNRIARWDGAAWHPLGSGMDNAVFALAVGPDGSLYAGGLFTTAGGVAATHIARWDPPTSSWHPLGSGMSSGGLDAVYALAIGPDGSLYAGGYFTTAGGVTANDIARWDGVAWHPLGSGMASTYPGYSLVYALAFGLDGTLYAGGHFTTAGGATVNHIARWNPPTSSWHPLGSGMSSTNDDVYALTIGPDGSLYAGGYFTTAGGVAAANIALWDGNTWHSLGSGMAGGVAALAFGPDGSLYTGGYFTTAGGVAAGYIARWDRSTSAWHALGSGMNRPVLALAFGPNNSLYAGGVFTAAGGVAANHIARWDEATASWYPMPPGNGMNERINTLAPGPDGLLYAGGLFTTAGGVPANYVARWDQATSSWHPLGSGMDGVISALAFGPDGSLYTGGGFTTAGGLAANGIARWDGSAWHAMGSGMGGSSPDTYALAVGPDGSLYAGGEFTSAGGVAANGVARWDGASWYALGSGVNGSVFALAFGPDGSLYAGGSFTTAGGVAANHLALWDATTSSWHPVGGGTNDLVQALALGPDDSLYVGGYFTTAGGLTANHIARWDQATSLWRTLDNGVSHGVLALAFEPDRALYAGGQFATAGGVGANNIALWDGTMWHPFGSGMSGTNYPYVNALAVMPDGSLYAGGYFSFAGGVLSSHIARWTAPDCDFNSDGLIDVDDIIIVAGLWSQPAGAPYDRDGDGWITIVDVGRVARWWGTWVP